MDNLDQQIREALKADAGDVFVAGENEPNIFAQMAVGFRSRHRWLMVMVFVLIWVYLGLAIYCGYKFFNVDPSNTRALIGWSIGALFGILTVANLKIWYWMELNKYMVEREVKRLELQVSRLTDVLARAVDRRGDEG